MKFRTVIPAFCFVSASAYAQAGATGGDQLSALHTAWSVAGTMALIGFVLLAVVLFRFKKRLGQKAISLRIVASENELN